VPGLSLSARTLSIRALILHGAAVHGLKISVEQVSLARSRSVAIPNVGGFAELSYHYANAKISMGYRADFFFGRHGWWYRRPKDL
jgi:hypothetical protein